MKILFVERHSDATGYYRCEVPVRHMQRHGIAARKVTLLQANNVPHLAREDVEWADVVLFQRPLTAREGEVITHVKTTYPEKLLVADYDDDYGSVPTWNPGYPFVRKELASWRNILPMFDGIVSSTPYLSEVLASHANKPVRVIKNSFDLQAIDATTEAPELAVKRFGIRAREGSEDVESFEIESLNLGELRRRAEGKRMIAWFGSHTHYVDLDWVIDDLRALCEERSDLLFVFVGFNFWKTQLLLDWERTYFVPGVQPVENYYRVLRTLKADVALAPVDPIAFNRSKSALKVYESQLFGMFPVASRFDTYIDDIQFGLLADYRFGAWRSRILEAFSDPARELKIGTNERLVRQACDGNSRVPEYVTFFHSLRKGIQ